MTATRSRRDRTAKGRRPGSALRAGIGTVVAASAAPYGYTLTIWSSGAVLIDCRGKPSVGDAFLFLAGAVLGFSVLGLLAQGPPANRGSIDRRRDRVIAGALDWAAVGAAVGAVALVAKVPGWVVWPLGSFVGTVLYLAGAGLQLGLVAANEETLANRVSGDGGEIGRLRATGVSSGDRSSPRPPRRTCPARSSSSPAASDGGQVDTDRDDP